MKRLQSVWTFLGGTFLVLMIVILAGCASKNLSHPFKTSEEYNLDASYCSQRYMQNDDPFERTYGNRSLPGLGFGIGAQTETSWDRCMRRLGWYEGR